MFTVDPTAVVQMSEYAIHKVAKRSIEAKKRVAATIFETLRSIEPVSRLAEAIWDCGLNKTLDGQNKFTIFAPTDTIVDTALRQIEHTDDIDRVWNIQRFVLRHVAHGNLSRRDLIAATKSSNISIIKVPTLAGDAMYLTAEPAMIKTTFLKGKTIREIAKTVECSNGTIHILRKSPVNILVPPVV